MTVPGITLNDGNIIPQLGFGTYRIDADSTNRIVTDALEVGYRHIDTAAVYGNEEGVGKAIASSGIPRGDLFVTTKLQNQDHIAEATQSAFDTSLDRLGLDYVDLYLIHWPLPKQGRYVAIWKELELIHASGRARSIGVSNFLVPHLERLLSEAEVVPAVDQIELHPYHQQPAVTSFAREHGIQIQGWGALGQAKYPLLELPTITSIASAHDRSAAQVVLRWHIQRGHVVFPKSNSRQRMAENFDVFNFELTEREQDAITRLERGGRVGSDPNEVN